MTVIVRTWEFGSNRTEPAVGLWTSGSLMAGSTDWNSAWVKEYKSTQICLWCGWNRIFYTFPW